MQTKLTKTIFIYIISFIYAYIFASLPNDLFRDRANYLVYAERSNEIMERYNGLAAIFNEPLFLLSNKLLNTFFSYEIIPSIFVFFICFTISFIILVRSKNIILGIVGIICILSMAQTFHLQLVILRQGLATCLLLWLVHLAWNKKYFLYLVLCLSFIHSSIFIIFLFLVTDKLINYFISDKIIYRVMILILISTFVSVLIIPFAELLSMRQAQEYNQSTASISGGNFALYSLILMTLLSQRKKDFSNDGIYTISLIGISIYIGMYFFSPFSGRLISTFIPFIICTLCYFNNIRAYAILVLITIINLFIFSSTIINNSLTPKGVMIFNSF